ILTPGSVLNVAVGELTRRPTPSPAPGSGSQKDMQSVLDETERRHIIQALEAANWVIAGPNGAAVRLGMKRSTLHARMQKLGVQITRSGATLSRDTVHANARAVRFLTGATETSTSGLALTRNLPKIPLDLHLALLERR